MPLVVALLVAIIVALLPAAAARAQAPQLARPAVSDSFPMAASCTSQDPEESAFAFDDMDAACLARLARAAARCTPKGVWRVDFRGDGRTRRVEWRRCVPAGDQRETVDYVLVHHAAGSGSSVDYLFDNAGAPHYSRMSAVTPISLVRRGDRRGLHFVGVLSGTGRYMTECLLGPRGATGAKLGCWPLPSIGPSIMSRLRRGDSTCCHDAYVAHVDPAGTITYEQTIEHEHDVELPPDTLRIDVALRGGRYVVARVRRIEAHAPTAPE